jgi:hypothetical protein
MHLANGFVVLPSMYEVTRQNGAIRSVERILLDDQSHLGG